MSAGPPYHAGSTPRQIRNSPEPGLGARRVDNWLLISLVVLAVITRFGWAIWVHPPQDHVFSDMAHYVHRARLVANWDLAAGDRAMAWQAWGTHALLAIPMVLLGPTGTAALEFAGLMWAGCSAATVVLSYRLAVRVLPAREGRPHGPAAVVGFATLVWIPLVSHTGFFVSETPYTCCLLAATLALVRLIQTGRGVAWAGVMIAICFALRPQVAVFVALLALAWVLDRRRRAWSGHVDLRVVAWFALPLVIVLGISLVRVRVYTGEFAGVAENGTMNLTAARCHNIVTRAFDSEAELKSAQTIGQPRAARRVSLPGFRALAREGAEHPLALRPALGGESIDFVGYIGDRAIHREIRGRCYAATGIAGQLRYSVTNVALAWVVARPWPESSDHAAPELLPVATSGRDLAAVLAPFGLLGMLIALWRWRLPIAAAIAEPDAQTIAGLGVCALQLLSFVLTAAIFFGDPRLRTPYDPYALILAAALGCWSLHALRSKLARTRHERSQADLRATSRGS